MDVTSWSSRDFSSGGFGICEDSFESENTFKVTHT
jgi:hypothetical protein